MHTRPAPDNESETQVVLDRLFREEPGRILSVLIRACGDFDLAEDVLQEAVTIALARWPRDGIPPNPGGWLVTTARRRAVDHLRRSATWQRKKEDVHVLARLQARQTEESMDASIADERLRLIFTCCHPALGLEARIALTLRTLGGLTAAEIARAFLTTESTIAQRLVRAKRKIRDAGIPYRVPEHRLLPDRLTGVLAVLYLIYNESYAAAMGEQLVREDLAAEAIRLARLLVEQLPGEPEALGLLALMLYHDARRKARTGDDGSLILLEEQDRALWDRARIKEANRALETAVSHRRPGPYQLQAAIAGLHANAPTAAVTDWPRIAGFYDQLIELTPTPVVALNRVVAHAMSEGPAAGLALLEEVTALDEYHLYHATRAELLRRLERCEEAAVAYRRALACVDNRSERAFLQRRLTEVGAR